MPCSERAKNNSMIFFIFYHHTASFPALPIYYGFSGEYYIKSKNFSKKIISHFWNGA